MRRSPNTASPSASSPTSPTPTIPSATSCRRSSKITPRRPPNSARPFDSNPTSPSITTTLAWPFSSREKLDEAIVEYRDASRLQPDFADAHLGLGEILEFQGKLDDAIVEYRTASRLQPNLADAHNSLAWALVKKRRCSAQERNEALEHARRRSTLSPDDSNFRTTLALAEYRAGHWAESIAAAERSLAMTKGEAPGFFAAMGVWQQGARTGPVVFRPGCFLDQEKPARRSRHSRALA